jgi:pimeloyl-ACP methyl ester carboxylesterase
VVTPIDIDIDVPGGRLHAGGWGSAASAAVLLLHGVTASHVCWQSVASALPDLRLIAPDLRGRGASSSLPGPYGFARHAADVVALLDAQGVDRAVVVGHSMGGFVSIVLAHLYPDRVSRLVLVDGGPPLEIPTGMTPADYLQAILGPSLARLTTTFPSREAYRDYWRAHPAFANAWSPAVEAYVDYDLVGDPPAMHSRTSPDAVAGDNTDGTTGTVLMESMTALAHPTALLTAPRGLLNEPTPLYSERVLADWAGRLPLLTVRQVPDVNHYTIIFDPRGVAEVAAAITDAVRDT